MPITLAPSSSHSICNINRCAFTAVTGRRVRAVISVPCLPKALSLLVQVRREEENGFLVLKCYLLFSKQARSRTTKAGSWNRQQAFSYRGDGPLSSQKPLLTWDPESVDHEENSSGPLVNMQLFKAAITKCACGNLTTLPRIHSETVP